MPECLCAGNTRQALVQSCFCSAAQHDPGVSMTVWLRGVLSSNMFNAKRKPQLILKILLLTKQPGMLVKHTPLCLHWITWACSQNILMHMTKLHMTYTSYRV